MRERGTRVGRGNDWLSFGGVCVRKMTHSGVEMPKLCTQPCAVCIRVKKNIVLVQDKNRVYIEVCVTMFVCSHTGNCCMEGRRGGEGA